MRKTRYLWKLLIIADMALIIYNATVDINTVIFNWIILCVLPIVVIAMYLLLCFIFGRIL